MTRLATLEIRISGGETMEGFFDGHFDAGRRGLEFFRAFGPSYAKFTRTNHNLKRDFVRRYEAHADIVFWSADGETLAWQAGAADRIKARLRWLLEPGGAEFTRLGEVIGEVVDAADHAVYEKAAATLALYADRIDGRTAAEVRALVDHHANSSWLRAVFVPAYEAKVAAFNDICTDTDERLASCWRRLTEALATINRSSARRTP